ncbi:MAG: PTS sugar transporter subunit IIA [Candidatus Fermentibacteria bacterium]
MKLSDLIKSDTVSLDCTPESDEQLLRCIARIASGADSMSGISEDLIFEALSDREQLSSTAWGHGVAIPHCRLSALSEFTAGLVILSEGIDFNAPDGEKVYLFPFVIGPENEPRTHLKLLSSLAQAFRDRKLRESLREVSTVPDAIDTLKTRISPSSSNEPGSGKMLIHVFVQDEAVFDELLQVFASDETSSTMVMDAHESTGFLMKSPFFAGFWNTDIQQFNRIIISVVQNELVNAVVRNIEFICGPLSHRNDVMVTVSELQSVSGSLES